VHARSISHLFLGWGLIACISACQSASASPTNLPTFTPRALPEASATVPGGPYSPTLTPVPLGQLPNVLATYRMRVVLDFVGHRIQVQQAVDVVNPGPDRWDSLTFQLPAAVQTPAFIFSGITISQAGTQVNANYALKGYSLRVVVPGGLPPGAGTSVSFEYGLDAQADALSTRPPDGNVGYSGHILQLVNWYPILAVYQPGLGWLMPASDTTGPLPGDPIYTEAAAYEVTVTAPTNITVVSGGLVNGDNQGHWKFALKNARTIALAASDDFASLAQVQGGTRVTAYFLREHGEAGKAALNAAVQSLALFTDRFGAYPYPDLAVAEDAYLGSVTASGLVLHSGQGFADYDGKPDSLLIATLPQAMSRLWWGQIVEGDAYNQPWLNEALPMYSEYLFIESFYPDLKTWYWDSRINYWKPSGLLGRRVDEFKDTEDYLRNLLRRGAQFVHGLRQAIGDDAFFSFLADFYRNSAYRTVNAADFFNALRRHTDSNLEPLLTEYFIGQSMPTPAPTLTPAASPVPVGPPTATPVIHVVRAGESLTGIAAQYGVSVAAIVKANSLRNPDSIYTGQQLVIPQH
jgi:hypothetical protein